MDRRGRREFLRGGLALAGLGLLAGCGLPAPALPQPARTARIGLLSPNAADPSPEGAAFRQALHDLGYQEGQNLTIQARYASSPEGLAARAAELAGQQLDVIVTAGNAATRAAREATSTIPIVMAESSDPVGDGLVASLGRPGGNVTGLATLGAQLGPKRLELLKEIAPRLSEVVVAWMGAAGSGLPAPEERELRAAAEALGVRLTIVQGTLVSAGTAGGRLMNLVPVSADGLLVLTDLFNRTYQPSLSRLVEFAAQRRLPAIYEARSFVEAGGLMAYGTRLAELYGRAAVYVDKILKGTKPADLPIEQPTTFDFVLNLKTAQALGLTIPESTRLQVTEVIQ